MSLRLDALLRWGVELAAETNGGPVSGFIERAIEDALRRTTVSISDRARSLFDIICETWDPEEPLRFIKVAAKYPQALSRNQLLLWHLMQRHLHMWSSTLILLDDPNTPRDNSFDLDSLDIKHDKLKRAWPRFKAVARGEISERELE